MIKKYNFKNSANKELMAEILSKRDRHPRSLFLSSLAAVMVAAISLTMVFGSLSTSAMPIEQPKQQTVVSSVSDGDALPPEEVTRVHTETKTETVTVYNDKPQLSETLVLPELVGTKTTVTNKSLVTDKKHAEGKSLFDKKQQRYQWQYGDEIFTFFVKGNTVYRRNETTGSAVVVFKGYKKASLFCVTDKYLFFGADVKVYDTSRYGEHAYCYRLDLLSGDILRLFYYALSDDPMFLTDFIRFDGTDVIFTDYIVHEDGNYEYFSGEPETSDDEYEYNETNTDPFMDLIYHSVETMRDEKNLIYITEDNGNCYDLGISVQSIESLGYDFYDKNYGDYLYFHNSGYKYISLVFGKHLDEYPYDSFLYYYGEITDSGVKGGFIELTNISDLFYNWNYLYKDLYLKYYDEKDFIIPIDFDKLYAPTKSEPENYFFDNGELALTLTYYPINSLHAATPDSAE